MLFKLSALAALASTASALTITTPTNWTSGTEVTVTWTSLSSDPVFSFELVNVAFNDAFALQNNVQPSLNTLTFELPLVPEGSGYTLEAVNIANINQVYSTTGGFSIAAAPASVSSTASSASPSALSSSSSSAATTPSSSAPSSSGSSSSASASQPATFGGTGGAAQSGISWVVMGLGAAAAAAIGL